MTTETKVCKSCKVEKHRSSFYEKRDIGKSGKRYLSTLCRSCEKEKAKERRAILIEKRKKILEQRKLMPKTPNLSELKIGELKSGPWFDDYMARIEAGCNAR